jgi:hypothetical protein
VGMCLFPGVLTVAVLYSSFLYYAYGQLVLLAFTSSAYLNGLATFYHYGTVSHVFQECLLCLLLCDSSTLGRVCLVLGSFPMSSYASCVLHMLPVYCSIRNAPLP